MEYLGEDKIRLFLHKEWLVKNDLVRSVPYLLKFYVSTVDQYCCILLTDTKHVWGEVLSSKQISRRWRDCNPLHSPPATQSEEDEDGWQSQLLDLLSDVHSLGGIIDLSFDIVETRNADLAFELKTDSFKWRWETYSLGPKVSADVLSQQLIMPLISVTHLAFTSADPVSELSQTDLEKSVDRVGRTARRSVDTHVKHALTRPRVATTLRRMTTVFNFLPDNPSILSDVATPDLKVPAAKQSSRATSRLPRGAAEPSREASPLLAERSLLDPASPPPRKAPATRKETAPTPPAAAAPDDDGSMTEQSSGEEDALNLPSEPRKAGANLPSASPPVPASSLRTGSPGPSRLISPHPEQRARSQLADDPPSEGSSPVRPSKKPKRAVSSSSDDDSEEERKKRLARLKGSASTRGGVKQPLKRGGRRF